VAKRLPKPSARILVEPSGLLAKEAFNICMGEADYISARYPMAINPMCLPYDSNIIGFIVSQSLNQAVTICTPNQKFTVRMREILEEEITYCLENNQPDLLHVYDRLKERAKRNSAERVTINGITSRLSWILKDDRLNNILCGNGVFNLRKFIQNKKTLILETSELNFEQEVVLSNVLSQIINAYYRYDCPEKPRPLSVFVDEAHSFANTETAMILKHARKYNMSFCLASQDLEFFEYRLRGVLLNINSQICFRAGSKVASFVAREMGIKSHEIQFLEDYQFFFKQGYEVQQVAALRPPVIICDHEVRPKLKSTKSIWF
jgi:hypothetical protein